MRNKKPIEPGVIRIVPKDNRLLEMPPYVNDHMSLPRWYKAIPKDANASVRGCAGISEFLKIGITVPAWTNMHFRPNAELRVWESRLDEFSPPGEISRVDGFPYSSTGECPMTKMRKLEEGYQYPKIVTPFKFQTAKGWSTMIMPLIFEPNPNYSVVPGIVHTDYYHTVNCVLNITANSDFRINYGTPLFQLIPFKRNGDIEKIIFEDDFFFKYYESGGFGHGYVIPTGVNKSGAYRGNRKDVDKEVEDLEKSSNIFRKIFGFKK